MLSGDNGPLLLRQNYHQAGVEPSCAKAGSAAHVKRRRRRKDEYAAIPLALDVTVAPIVAQPQSVQQQHPASLENSPTVPPLN